VDLLLLSFGTRLENHFQAAFSILSFLARPGIERVFVLTDAPRFYAQFGARIEILPIDEALMSHWRGDSGFFWRIKIKAIEKVVGISGHDLLYVDSDTFLAGDLTALSSALASGATVMHRLESRLSQRTSSTEKAMWAVLRGKTFSGIRIDDQTAMWNAGVIGLPGVSAGDDIARTLELCDALCATPCTRRLIEQFSFSLALASGARLTPCDNAVIHYWGNKPDWNRAMREFFVEAALTDADLSERISRIADFDFQALPILRKESTARRRMVTAADWLFPPKRLAYFE
jgi:hypothetical protein